MSENDSPQPEVPEPAPTAPPKRSFRERMAGTGDRVYGTRGLIAATLAALIVGGFGGAAIHAAVDGDRHEHGSDFVGRMGGGFGGERPGPPGDFRHAPVPGQLPPTTVPTPEDEESAPTPSPSDSSGS